VVWALLSYERARDRQGFSWLPPALGLLAAWLHPWQGELLILIVLVSEVLFWVGDSAARSARRLILPLVTMAAAALPLLYYAALDHADPVWRLGRHATLSHHWSLGKVLLPLIPLLVAAALAYRRRPRSFLQVATLVWPVATLVVFEFSKRLVAATPLHALTGVTIPLAVLAVQGVQFAFLRRVPLVRLIGVALVAAVTIPVTFHLMDVVRRQRVTPSNGMNLITHDEQRALTYLRDNPKPGGVLADFVLGALVPGETGRRTYFGNCDWSVPLCSYRFSATFNMFRWRHERAHMARRLTRHSGARFVLAGCDTLDPRLSRKLRPLLVSVHRFGCAAVYEVRPGHQYLL
jgi:multisubunit Na+/H+ antiporter MnhG subunit